MGYNVNNPWIKEREVSICLWKPDYIRGYISNMNTSLLVDFSVFSDKQLEDYALMLKGCGFTGAQVTDMCSAWRPSGSPEFFHDRLKVFADALHRNGMKFTLWCWAAEFAEHGWADPEVTYNGADGKNARDDEAVQKVFDKYYNIYSEMAPYCDRVIAHFYDPGRLPTQEDVLYFFGKFTEKFRSKNPNIKIGIDTWGAPSDFPDNLVAAGYTDVMLMELPFLPIWREEGKRARFRSGVKKLGCELGSWGWYTCEYETDQRPYMTINNRVLKDVYQQTREQADDVLVPSYWSEMDAYHVLNFFSLYASAQLLINPEADPDALLAESAEMIVGKENAKDFLYVLETIRDARSGDEWNTYWWSEGHLILRIWNPEEMLERAQKSSEILKSLVVEKQEKGNVALPVKVWQMLKLMQPHIEQIKAFAQFRIDFEKLKAMYKESGDSEELRAFFKKIRKPIPEYNCVIGLWGQPEALEQTKILTEFSNETGIPVPRDGARDFTFKRRIIDHLTVDQRQNPEKVFWTGHEFYEGGVGISIEELDYLIGELVDEGVLIEAEDGSISLADAESIRYDFNI